MKTSGALSERPANTVSESLRHPLGMGESGGAKAIKPVQPFTADGQRGGGLQNTGPLNEYVSPPFRNGKKGCIRDGIGWDAKNKMKT